MRLLYGIFLLFETFYGSGAFITSIPIKSSRKMLPLSIMHAFPNKNISLNHNQNNTKKNNVFRMDFTEETEEEQLFKPRYRFGLSEFDMILLKIYVYMVVTIYCITMIYENMKK